ncbi:MAG: NAD(P)H-hydrate dehydratase, partial [Methanobacterium paludis]|nr:NAD(P)H-hydrate dehydratase [Methanobacterium paludis]
VLTPHTAEFKAVFDLPVPQNFEDKVETVLEASKNSGCVVLLKGAVDVVSNGKYVRLNTTGNPGMTVGGTGDVLAGLVGGLIAQSHDAFEAAYLGAYINGVAGDLASSEYGYNFLASDILRYIPRVFMG